MTNFKIKHFSQSSTSACCGPCCIASILDYYKVLKANGASFTKHSLIKLLDCTKDGVQEEDIIEFLSDCSLETIKMHSYQTILRHIRKKVPILVGFPGVPDYHYSIMTGYDIKQNIFIFCDPLYGIDFKRSMDEVLYLIQNDNPLAIVRKI